MRTWGWMRTSGPLLGWASLGWASSQGCSRRQFFTTPELWVMSTHVRGTVDQMGDLRVKRSRARDDIVRIVHRGLDLPELAHAVGRSLSPAVPFDGTCLLTLDPATLLPTGEIVENGLPAAAMGRLTEIELGEPDFNKLTTLARAAVPAASLSQATGGDLDRSLRQREIRRPAGFADELRAVLTDDTGSRGALTLLREVNRPAFTPAEVRFVASLAPILAEGVSRATLPGETTGDGDPPGTGFLVLAADDTVELANPMAELWIDELSAHDRPANPLRGPFGPSWPRPGASLAAARTGSPAPGSVPAPDTGSSSAARPWEQTWWPSCSKRLGRPSSPRRSPTPTASPSGSGRSPPWWQEESPPPRSPI